MPRRRRWESRVFDAVGKSAEIKSQQLERPALIETPSGFPPNRRYDICFCIDRILFSIERDTILTRIDANRRKLTKV